MSFISAHALLHNETQCFTTLQNFHYIDRRDYEIIWRLTKQQPLLKYSFIVVSRIIVWYSLQRPDGSTRVVRNRRDKIQDSEIVYLQKMYLLWDGIVWLTEIHIQVFGRLLTWENQPLWRRCKTLLKACMNIDLPNVVGAIDGSHVRNKGTEHRTLSSVTLRAHAPAVRWPSCLWACMGISTTALRIKKYS